MIEGSKELSRTRHKTACNSAIGWVLFLNPDESHIFLSRKKFYWYRPDMRGKLPKPRDIADFWMEEERGGPDYRATIGNEILIGNSEIRYYLKIRASNNQPIINKIPIKGFRIPGDDGESLEELFPEINLWLLPFPFEKNMMCHRLDPERFDRKTGKPYVFSVYEPTCRYCHNWILPGPSGRRDVKRSIEAYENILAGQKYCSPECRYKAQLERQKWQYHDKKASQGKISFHEWLAAFEAGRTPTSNPSTDLPRCDNCGGVLQRKRTKRSEGRGQYCSDRCRKAHKRRIEREAIRASEER